MPLAALLLAVVALPVVAACGGSSDEARERTAVLTAEQGRAGVIGIAGELAAAAQPGAVPTPVRTNGPSPCEDGPAGSVTYTVSLDVGVPAGGEATALERAEGWLAAGGWQHARRDAGTDAPSVAAGRDGMNVSVAARRGSGRLIVSVQSDCLQPPPSAAPVP